MADLDLPQMILDGLRHAALYVDQVPTAGLVVTAVVLHAVSGDDSKPAAPWVLVSGVVLLLAYLAHQYVTDEPFELGHFVVLGLRGVAVLYIYRPIANLVDFILDDARQWQRARLRSFGSTLANWRKWRSDRREQREAERRHREAIANTPEPLSDEEAFEVAMSKAQADFDRRCVVINNNRELDPYEREAAVAQARATMTKRVHQIMQGDY